ncbi:MAG: hypothetical protein AAGI30_10715 [Planctomycetota bacterium]
MTRTIRILQGALSGLAASAAIVIATSASAQADRESAQPVETTVPMELRQEIERLTAAVEALRADLGEAERIIADLQLEAERLRAENAALREQARGMNAGGAAPDAPANQSAQAPPPTTALDPAIFETEGPLASPSHLAAALQADYEASLTPPTGTPNDGVLTRYFAELGRWAQLSEPRHEVFRGPVAWVVALEWITPRSPGVQLRFQVIDPFTGAPFSQRRLDVRVPDRLADIVAQRPGHQLWLLGAVVRPTVRVDPQRREPGYFDDPQFIGPYAAMELSIDAIQLEAIGVEADTETTAAQ